MFPLRWVFGLWLAVVFVGWGAGSCPAQTDHGGIVFVKGYESYLRGNLLVFPAGAWLDLENDPEYSLVCKLGGNYFQVPANLVVTKDKVREFASEMLLTNPKSDVAFRVMCHLRYQEGDLKKALADIDKAIDLSRKPYVHDFLERGKIRAGLGMVDEALSDFSRAVELSKETAHLPLALVKKGQMHLEKGQVPEAFALWDAAAEMAPVYPEPLLLKAWVLCTHPSDAIRNSEKALQLAQKAADIAAHSHDEPKALEALAAAYAEKGEFLPAIRTLSKAFDSKGPRNPTQVAMMEQFLERRPYRHGAQAKESERVTVGK